MSIKRRDFIKGCAAAGTLMVPGMAMAAQVANAANEQGAAMNTRIEKSIKASFGGGFSVQAHTQSTGLTYANIEHFGTRYQVASADLFDWKLVRTL
ncbi:MAG: twin-arginine translocation signal domain-containing protein [Pusillimonas sp.]|nr:twin-arginine translocation signal domain-containing protein [Pusillimonas sp.]